MLHPSTLYFCSQFTSFTNNQKIIHNDTVQQVQIMLRYCALTLSRFYNDLA